MDPAVDAVSVEELKKNLSPGYILYLQVDDEDLKMNLYYRFEKSQHTSENAGYDLLTAENWTGATGEKAHLLDLGVRAMLINAVTKKPVNYWLVPRSSIYKTGHMMANAVGVIDNSYRGILKAPVIAVMPDAPGFKKHERHFQIVAPDMGHIQAVYRVESLPTTERGEGGFGSTGN
jgi:dUTP pyrophosphatase